LILLANSILMTYRFIYRTSDVSLGVGVSKLLYVYT